MMYTVVLFLMITACLAAEESVPDSGDTVKEKCASSENKYSREANTGEELTDEEMFKRGHMKPFGSHRPPDFYADEIPFMISPEDFYMKYVIQHKPVVLKGAAKNWPAYTLWTDEYMKMKYGNRTVKMETKDDDKYNLPKSRKLETFLDEYLKKDSKLYLVDEVAPKMREEVVLPLCLRCEEMDQFFFVSFLWLSGGGTMSTAHIDTDENLLCVLKGHKKSIMVSPIYSKYLYADDARVQGVSDVNTSSVDMEKYPDVKKIKYWVATAEEGDCFYIPQMWWHQVYSRKERQLAIALWWKSKPFWKSIQNSEKLRSKKYTPEQKKEKKAYSFSEALKEYEEWVLEVAPTVPRIRCKEQQVLMSNYQWESDYVEGGPTTLGDGGNVEEEVAEDVFGIGPIMKKVAEMKEKESPCFFDKLNKKSPCHYKDCTDDDDSKCLKYILDYCGNYADRGCVINKPHLLNKKDQQDMKEVFNLPSKF